MRWFWGLLIAIIGVIFLGQSLNFWGANQIADLSQFWPLLLILLGIALLARHLRFGWIIILASFILALVFIYFASFSTKPAFSKVIRRQGLESFNFSNNLPENAVKARIIIETGAIDLHLSSSSDKLIDGSLKSRYAEPDLTLSEENNIVTATLKTTKNIGFIWGSNTLDVKITNKIPVELIINSGASSLNLDTSEIALDGLEINAGASSINLKIGKIMNNSALNIKSGASSINIDLPSNIGFEIVAKSGLSSKEINNFNQIDNNTFKNKNFDTSQIRAKLNIDAGASSIKISEY